MITSALARDLAALARLGEDTSTERVLHGLTSALSVGVPGCSGGSAERWSGGRQLLSASHTELIDLVEGERRLGGGPSRAAKETGRRALAEDLLHEPRWPGYAALAIARGIRSALLVPVTVPSCGLLVGLYSVRPRAFPEAAAPALGELLTEQLGMALDNQRDFDEVRTGAAQLQQALAGRAVIDQAKGIIMKSSGCSAEEAFEELRRVSQHHQIKVAELAKLLVEEYSRGG